MKAWMIAALFFVVFLVLAGSLIAWGVGKYNTAAKTENSLVAQDKACQSNLSQYSNKIAEMIQVPTQYKNDYKDVLTAALQGRYGKDGSKATFQWLKEHNIAFDSSLYGKVQDQIAIGRDKFENEQKKLIDRQRVYEDSLSTFPDGVFLKFFGFPTAKVANIKIIKSGYANEVYETGIDNGLKLNK